MRRANRVDANQPEIVRQLREIGCSVLDTHDLGKGAPDIVVGWRGYNWLFEVKSDKGRMTPDETTFHLTWQGQIHVIRNVEQALEIMAHAR